MDSEWSDKFTQHKPSNSSQPCPCASRRKSMAALFCKVPSLTALTSVITSLTTMEVALICLLNQHPKRSNCFNATAEASWGKNKPDVTVSFAGLQGWNGYSSLLHNDGRAFSSMFSLDGLFNTRCSHSELSDATWAIFNFWGNALPGSISRNEPTSFWQFLCEFIKINPIDLVLLPLGATGVVELHQNLEFLSTEWWGWTFNCGSPWKWNSAQNSIFKETRISNSWGLKDALRRSRAQSYQSDTGFVMLATSHQ